MIQEKYRKIIVVSFILGIIFILATITSFWNVFVTEKENIGYLPILFCVLAIASFSYLFKLSYKVCNVKALNDYIDQKVTEGHTVLLNEMKKNEEENHIKENNTKDIQENVNSLIPAGNFKKVDAFGKKLLFNIANHLNLVQGILYIKKPKSDMFSFSSGFAITEEKTVEGFKTGENLNGEVAKSQEIMIVDDIPEKYFTISSGLGGGKPGQLIILPIVSDKNTLAVIELASFSTISEKHKKILVQSTELLSSKLKQLIKA